VVVFKLPRDGAINYVERVIGLPGDEIVVRNAIVYINDAALSQTPAGDHVGSEELGRPKPRYEETLPNGVKHYVLHWARQAEYDNVGPFHVPAGHYFMMGDNRDNSIDSRVPPRYGVGYVPYDNLVGRVEVIYLSAAVNDPGAFRLTNPWTYIRWGRLGSRVR